MAGQIMRWTAVLGLLWMSASAHAARSATWYGSLVATVALDAQGQVQTLDWVDGDAGAVGAELLQHLRQIRFQPYRQEGRAVPGQGQLRVLLSAEREGRQFRQLRLHGVLPIIDHDAPVPPKYPVDALRRDIQGTVVLQVRFDANGKVEDVAHRAEHAVHEMLVRPAAEAAVHWVFRPEQLDGVAQPGVQAVPVTFTIENGRSPRRTLRLGTQELVMLTETPDVDMWATGAQLQFEPPAPWQATLQ